MEGDIIKTTFSKTNSFFLKLAAFSTTALAIFGAYSFYKNNVWHPRIEIISIDYANGVANLKINGKEFVLRGDSTYIISYDWGIRFGYTFLANGVRMYDRIEVTKRNMVHQIIRQSDSPSVLAFNGENPSLHKKTHKNLVFGHTGFVGDESTFWNEAFDNK